MVAAEFYMRYLFSPDGNMKAKWIEGKKLRWWWPYLTTLRENDDLEKWRKKEKRKKEDKLKIYIYISLNTITFILNSFDFSMYFLNLKIRF